MMASGDISGSNNGNNNVTNVTTNHVDAPLSWIKLGESTKIITTFTPIPHMYTQGMLTGEDIVKAREKGDIVIHPFNKDNVKGNSYDITLGEHFYELTPVAVEYRPRVTAIVSIDGPTNPASNTKVTFPTPVDDCNISDLYHDPWSKESTAKLWQKGEAKLGKDIHSSLKPDAKYIIIKPKHMVLCHTQECIGARHHYVPIMHTRSSMGRNCIDIVAGSSGFGDIGYIGRWTMEITNHHPSKILCLQVGQRVGQISFMTATSPGSTYTGKYQNTTDLQSLIDNWEPSSMLPRAYLDN